MSTNNPSLTQLLVQQPTINPYRYAAYELWNRIKWDLNPESWRSRRKLKQLKDKCQGSKAVIVCNGPSLLKSDLSLLEGVFTFGLNKINLLFDKSSFRPSCIVAINPFVIEQNAEFYNQTDIPLFLDSYGVRFVRSRKNTTFIPSSSQPKFAKDCSLNVYGGYTVTFVAMQLAFHMGFKHVALIGCDHNFVTKGPANLAVASGEKDENHFAPNYFAGGVMWHLPDLEGSELAYRMARDMYQAAEKSIVNATDGGCLELFPRMSLEQFIHSSASSVK